MWTKIMVNCGKSWLALHSPYTQSVYYENSEEVFFPKCTELTCEEHFVLFFGFVSVWGTLRNSTVVRLSSQSPL